MANSRNSLTEKHLNSSAQQRLLDAAERLFADHGFGAASVRDITKNADCNVAAVNYHFGSKENLYIEVFRRRMTALRDARLASIQAVMSQTQSQPTLEQLLRTFATAFLEPLIDQSDGRTFMKLMVREISDPRLPRKMFVDELTGPTFAALGDSIRKLCPRLEQDKILLSIISVIGQLVHVIHINEMVDLDQFTRMPPPGLTEMVEHIVEFSAAGIRAAAKTED
jgi:AcrR family transcriptional regulator